MPEKRSENNQKLTRDPHVALEAADAFRSLSQPFLERVRREGTVANPLAGQSIGSMIASATTLALSVELYLKVLQLLVGFVPLHDHDLCALFKRFPSDLKTSAESEYKILTSSMGTGIDMIALQISVEPFHENQMRTAHGEDARKTVLSKGDSLESVLKRNKDAFLTWRYLYEKGNPTGLTTLIYEFANLSNAAEAIRRHVLKQLVTSRKGR